MRSGQQVVVLRMSSLKLTAALNGSLRSEFGTMPAGKEPENQMTFLRPGTLER